MLSILVGLFPAVFVVGGVMWLVNSRGVGKNSEGRAALELEQKVKRHFVATGWRVRPTVLCSFTAEKDDLQIYVLCGTHLMNPQYTPTQSYFLRNVNHIKASVYPRRPIVLAIVADSDGAKHYRGIAGGQAAILELSNINFTNLLSASGLSAADDGPGAQWASEVIENDADLCRKQSKIAAQRGDSSAARKWAQRAVAADGGYWASHYHLSGLQLEQGELDAAETSARIALRQALHPAPVLRRLSEIELRRGRIADALKLINEAIANDNSDANSYHHLAWIHMKSKNFAAAETAERTAVQLAPVNPAFTRRLEEIKRVSHAT